MPSNRTKPIEVAPKKGADPGWEVRRQGTAKPISTHKTQAAAVTKAKPLAKREQTEFVLKGRNRQIRDRSSYGTTLEVAASPRSLRHVASATCRTGVASRRCAAGQWWGGL